MLADRTSVRHPDKSRQIKSPKWGAGRKGLVPSSKRSRFGFPLNAPAEENES